MSERVPGTRGGSLSQGGSGGWVQGKDRAARDVTSTGQQVASPAPGDVLSQLWVPVPAVAPNSSPGTVILLWLTIRSRQTPGVRKAAEEERLGASGQGDRQPLSGARAWAGGGGALRPGLSACLSSSFPRKQVVLVSPSGDSRVWLGARGWGPTRDCGVTGRAWLGPWGCPR